MRKTIYCTLDTETVGGASNPTGMYNLGCVIHDKQGNILATTSMLVMEHYDEIRNDDYAKKNFPIYEERLCRGEMSAVATETEAVEIVRNLCKFYGVKYVMAYNSGFDFSKTACRSLLDDFEFIDIQYAFFDTVAKQKKYNRFCCENGYVTAKGNIQMTAEIAHRFCSKDFDFVEEHTALNDALIEMQIFLAVLGTHKKYTRNIHKGDHFYKVIKAQF